MCRLKRKTRSCHYFNRVEKLKDDPELRQLGVIDIEDIVTMGKQRKFCPYFMSRELKTNADIIFMPYNYLLSPSLRKVLGKLNTHFGAMF